jgi:hypothetical protein
VIGLPPSLGGVQVTVADAGAAVAMTAVGAPGAIAGVTMLEGAESGPVPTPFTAVTTKLYEVPFVSPFTVNDVAGGEPFTVMGVSGVVPSLTIDGVTR